MPLQRILLTSLALLVAFGSSLAQPAGASSVSGKAPSMASVTPGSSSQP